MLRNILVFLCLGLIAYWFNVEKQFPWLTGVIFGFGIYLSARGQKIVSLRKFAIISITWSTTLYYIIALLIYMQAKSALQGLPLTWVDAVKISIIIGVVNGIGFGTLNNLLLCSYKLTKYHLQVLIISLVLGFFCGMVLVERTDYGSFLSLHVIWFLVMGWAVARKVDDIPVVLSGMNSKQ